MQPRYGNSQQDHLSVGPKIALAIVPDQAYNSYKLEATPTLTHGQAAVWGAVNSLSDHF